VAVVREVVGRELKLEVGSWKLEVSRFRVLVPLAVALPGLVVALLTGVSGVGALIADRPLVLAPVPRNVAEAAGNRDVADVVVMAPSS
jgi:hypothetical protein